MRYFRFIFLFLLFPYVLQAQAIGQVPWGARVFSPNFPAKIPDEWFEGDGPKMSEERREIALRCIERTFGKVKEYEEHWGDCIGELFFEVELETGDRICFVDGCVDSYDIVSSRFAVGRDRLPGGLRVGQKLNPKKSRGEWVIQQSDQNSTVYYFTPPGSDDGIDVIVDDKGIIQSIHKFTNYC